MDQPRSEDTMRIGELAERGDVSTKTIRYYESIGLLDEPARTSGGYRSYDDDAVERLRFVRDAQASGLTLREIASVLRIKAAGDRSCEHTTSLLERHLAEVDAQIERLTAAREELARLAERARGLDPAACVDPNRCQVIG
ncbi:MAG: heavy metal-responsive transcriptional regulator [Actinomycetota bacterium]